MTLTRTQDDLLRLLVARANDGWSKFHYLPHIGGSLLLFLRGQEQDQVQTEAGDLDLDALEDEGLILTRRGADNAIAGQVTGGALAATSGTPKAPAPPQGTHVFIGHGRSQLWRELKDFVSDRLGLTWDEFNREPPAGFATKERLEQMLANASFALVVMTAEEARPDGTLTRARTSSTSSVSFKGGWAFVERSRSLRRGANNSPTSRA